MEGVAHRSYGPVGNALGFLNHASAGELRILGEIPLRKTDGAGNALLDPDGNPDTSFLARIPADTPFTFQTLDKDGLVLDMSQTWARRVAGRSTRPTVADAMRAFANGYGVCGHPRLRATRQWT